MIRQLAAAHESGSPVGSSNSVNHFTPESVSPIVLKGWSNGNAPAVVVTESFARYSVAPRRSPAHPTVPLSPEGSTVASQGKPGSGVTVTFALSTFVDDCQVTRKKRAVCAQQVSWTNVTTGPVAGLALAAGFPDRGNAGGPERNTKPITTRPKTSAIVTTTA